MPASGTEDLVREAISNLREAADNGDPDAIADLTKKTGGKATTAPVAPDVAAMISPDKKVVRPNGETYVVRKLGIHDDVMALRKAREDNINVLLYGLPGTGKTALIEAAFCAGEDAGTVYTVQGTGDTITDDFVGGYWQDEEGHYHWAHGPMVLAMLEGRPFYIDEVALIDPKVMALPYGLMDGRNELRITQNPALGVIKAQPGFYVVAACNPNAPGARMSEALLSRFSIQAEVTTDMGLARDLDVDPKLITAINNLRRKREKNIISWVPQMREMLDFTKIKKSHGLIFALRNLVATAPEQDRKEVGGTVSRQFAKPVTALTVD